MNACRLDWLDDVADVVHVRTTDGRLLYANKIARELFGWPESDGLTPVDPGDAPTVSEVIQQCEKVGRCSSIQERRDVNGNKVFLESRWSPIPVGDAAEMGWFVYEINTADGRLLDENMVRARRLESIGTLAGGVAHDINNVLGPILIGAEMIKRRVDDPWILKKLDDIEASAQRGAEVIRQVLDFSRGIMGEKIYVQLRYVLKELVTFADQSFTKTIRIVTDFSPDLKTVVGDAALLRQMVLHLMANARDAMPDGGTLTISAHNWTLSEAEAARLLTDGQAGNYVQIRVRDTGVGIPTDQIDRVFEPFYTTKVRAHGTGLGLSRSLSIAEFHGGYIRVDSTPGEGSEFSVWLPVAKSDPVSSGPDKPLAMEMVSSEGNALRILIVDAESAMLEMNADMLESMGCQTSKAANGQEGLDLFLADPSSYDLVVTDINMPVMSGAEMIRQIRHVRPTVPIIAVSLLSERNQLGDGIGLNDIQILPKPYDMDELTSLILMITSASANSDTTLSDAGFELLFGDRDGRPSNWSNQR